MPDQLGWEHLEIPYAGADPVEEQWSATVAEDGHMEIRVARRIFLPTMVELTITKRMPDA
jgi:hypothetical protein